MTITPSDHYDLPFPVNSLRVGQGGSLKVKLGDAGRTVRTLEVSDGEVVNLPILRVFATDTTAVDLRTDQFSGAGGTGQATLRASFYGVPVTGEAPLSVQFFRTTVGQSLNFMWGYTTPDAPACLTPFDQSGINNPTQVFEAAGNYTVVLQEAGINETGSEKVREEYIVVSPPALRDYDGTFVGTDDGVIDLAAVGRQGVWVDAVGGIWSTAAGKLKGVTSDSNGYRTQFLKRPVYEAFEDGTITVDFPATFASGGTPVIGVVGRLQPNGDHVLAHLDIANHRTFIYRVVGGTPTGGPDVWAEGAASSSWRLELILEGESARARTYRDGVYINEVGIDLDSAPTLNRMGVAAVSCWQTGQVQVSRVQVVVDG